MKKLLSLVLSIAIILGAVLSANIILAEGETPAREGGYMHVSNRNTQNSGPQQSVGDALKASGDGTYLLSAWVRIPGNTATKSVSLIVRTSAWPQINKSITGGEWTLVSGEISITGTAAFANNDSAFFRIQTTDNSDIDFDSVVLKKKIDATTYGENVIQDSACELNPFSPWYGSGAAISNPESNDTSLYGIEVDFTSNSSTMIAKTGTLDFVRDGATATVAIFNPGTESIKVELTIRKNDSSWTKVAGAEEWHTIPAGTGKTITITSSAEDTLADNFVILVTEEAGETGKLVLCNLTAQQAMNLNDPSKWCVTTSTAPKVVENPEFTEPSPSTSPSTSPETSPAPTPSTPELKAEGGYITTTNRVNQNSGPLQYVGDALKASGDGIYHFSAWVKIPENSSDKRVCLIIYAGFASENKYKYPQFEKVISNGEWTLVSGEIEIKDTKNITKNTDSYFKLQTGPSGSLEEKWDIWFDGITLNKKISDNNYGKNLFTNAEFNKEDSESWSNSTTCTITFVGATEKEEVKIPTGVIITALEETETNFIISNAGVVSKDDIKDGKISKSYTIINQGQEPVRITFALQTEHTKADTNKVWTSSEKGFTALIEPGDKQTLTYTMNVNKDGKITISEGDNEADYEPEKFFARFDIYEADSNQLVVKGTKLVILNNDPTLKLTAGAKDAINIEVTYSQQFATSDMIPFTAFAILPLMVAFVLVIKKRKEN